MIIDQGLRVCRFVALVLIGVLLVLGCNLRGPALRTEVATGLSWAQATIDPAYALVAERCTAADEAALAVAAKERTELALDQAEQTIAANRARCDAVIEVFEGMRLAHDRAVDAYESGSFERAQAVLADLRRTWTELQGQPAPDGGLP